MSGPIANHKWTNEDRFWSGAVDLDGLVRYWRKLYPADTAAHVAADLGEPVSTVKKWLLNASAPKGRAMLAIVCFYGPEAICACLRKAPAWLDAAVEAERLERLQSQLADTQSELARLRGRAGTSSSEFLRPTDPQTGA